MAFELIQTRVDLAVIELLRAFTNGLVQKRFRIELRVHTEDVKHDTRRRAVVSSTNDVTVANDEDEFALVVVVQCSQ